MKRSAPMMFSSQQRLQLKPKQTQQNADWDDIMPSSSINMSGNNDKPLRRGAIFISNSGGTSTSNSNGSVIIPDSLLVQLISMNISKPSSSLSSSSSTLSKTIPASASSHRTLFKKSRSRVHSRRKNRIAIVDNKIMMMKTPSLRSGSGDSSSSRNRMMMSSVSFTSLDNMIGSSSDMAAAA